jgi:exosome complex RNA-binding protein Rrp42 (RNase PH superfamily)
MKRREFIIGAISVTAVSISVTYLFLNRDIVYDPLIAEPQSLSLIWDTETVIAVGNQYRVQYVDENSEQALAKKLVQNLSGTGEKMIKNLNQKIKEDFEEDSTILIDGWILSKTEARQCALLSTLQPEK